MADVQLKIMVKLDKNEKETLENAFFQIEQILYGIQMEVETSINEHNIFDCLYDAYSHNEGHLFDLIEIKE